MASRSRAAMQCLHAHLLIRIKSPLWQSKPRLENRTLDPTILSAPASLGMHNLFFKLPADQAELTQQIHHPKSHLNYSLIIVHFLE